MIEAGQLVLVISPKGKRYMHALDPAKEIHTHDGRILMSDITEAQRREVRRLVGYSRFDEWLEVEKAELPSLWDKAQAVPEICAALILEALAADEDDVQDVSLGRYSVSLGGQSLSPKQALLAQAAALRGQIGQTVAPILTPWKVG